MSETTPETDPLAKWESVPENEIAGVWVDVPDTDGVQFKVCRLGGANLASTAALAELFAKRKPKTPTETAQLSAQAIADIVLVDWRGMPVPFSKGEAYRVLLGKPDLVEWVSGVCTDRATFRLDPRSGRVAGVPDLAPGEAAARAEDSSGDSFGADRIARPAAVGAD